MVGIMQKGMEIIRKHLSLSELTKPLGPVHDRRTEKEINILGHLLFSAQNLSYWYYSTIVK